ncbi:MAG: DUF2142 domain-containing protein [Actinobacteria bacterium]|nr:MAG: DUF2142 domain-containing protein [Actinomycetota bacterium]
MIRRQRLPGPLLALLAVAAVMACAWIVLIPPLQGPDEGGHIAYVQKMVERKTVPFFEERAPYRYSTEERIAGFYGGFEPLRGNLDARPLWTPVDVAIWRRADAAAGPDAKRDALYDQSFRNPPLYYAYAAVPYLAGRSGSFFARELLMRLANIPLLLLVVLFSWLVAAELFGGRRLPCLVATVPVALQPQLLNLSAVVNPDVALAAAWSAAILVLVRLLKRGPTRGRVAALAALCAASALIQPRGATLIAPAALALALLWRRRLTRPTARRAWIGGLAALLLLGAAGTAAWLVDGHPVLARLRLVGSYLWQFYLPRLPGMTPSPDAAAYGFREVFVDRFQGTLAQLEVTLPRSAEELLYVLTLAALAGLVLLAVRRRAWLARAGRWELIAVFAALLVVPIVAVQIVAARGLATPGFDPTITGRYLLPVLPLYGAAIAALVRSAPARLVPVAAGAVVGGALVLQLGSAGLLLARFYG